MSNTPAQELVNDSWLRQHFIDLCECSTPLLIGVRHHSAAIAAAMNGLLDRFKPEAVLVEMPADLQPWLEYLADESTSAPVAISAVDSRGDLAFYPLADFSPELVAIRWAFKHDVPMVACDLSVSANWNANVLFPAEQTPKFEPSEDQAAGAKLHDELMRRTHSRDSGQLWERLVESPAMLADVEAVRQMGLIFGWASRESSPWIPPRDRLREAAMRQAVRQSPGHSAAVIGAFHAAALLPRVIASECENDERLLQGVSTSPDSVGVSLVPYSFEQLDQRSGYPAGIRDPVWHQRMVNSRSPQAMDEAATQLVVEICRGMRRRGQVAGTPDATEVIRMMRDLARLRGLAAAGRGELIESIESCLVQGELHGRAREVARAAQEVLIGNRHGSVTSRAPRCGLALALDELLADLNMPAGESLGSDPKELRLDVLRLPRDRARAVVLLQLTAAGIPYAKRVDTIEQGQRENLAQRWQVGWLPGTSATIESVSRYGVTLPQVVEGILQKAAMQIPGDSDLDLLPAVVVQQLEVATQCGLHHRVDEWLGKLDTTLQKTGGLAELVATATILGRIAAGHVPGLPRDVSQQYPPIIRVFDNPTLPNRIAGLMRASLDRLDGLEGSNDPADIAGVSDLVHWFNGDLMLNDTSQLVATGQLRLISWCERTLRQGSDRMRGAAAGVLCILERHSTDELAALLGGWFDAAVDSESRQRLRRTLAGVVQVLLSMMQSDNLWLAGLEDRLVQSDDAGFLQRLPALRGAFASFSPADRGRILQCRLASYTERGSSFAINDLGTGDVDSDAVTRLMALRREADLAGRLAVESLMPGFLLSRPRVNAVIDETSAIESPPRQPVHGISMADRWRMIIGVPPQNSTSAGAAARSLDQLYGRGRGEGSRGGLASRRAGGGGGTEAPQPTTAEWADDLESLFGADVCQEVLTESAGSGNSAALDVLDPDTVTPSVELLQQVLSLAGGLAEGRAERLRRLARRITEQLARRLAVRLAPAMSGLSTPRPTRRRSRRLNLPRTIRENLVNAYRRNDGRAAIIAKSLVFNSQARREMDWHLSFVVDVSGSMTASVVYSALCAAIFAELPALSVRFFAFSTEVIDLSGRVADPLTLLLEVQVGGGTHIGLGLRAARAAVKVPSRSIVVLVSDFEEGVSLGEMLAEVRSLTTSGVKCVGLAALDDSGTARFHQANAGLVAAAGMPVAAVSPERLADWVGDQIRGQSGQAAKLPLGTISS